MSASVQQVLTTAQGLAVEEQEALVTEVISSLDGPPPSPEEAARIEAAWTEEFRRRIDAYERGEVELIDAEVVFARFGVKFPPDERSTPVEAKASHRSRAVLGVALTLSVKERAELTHLLLRHLDGADRAAPPPTADQPDPSRIEGGRIGKSGAVETDRQEVRP
jgi:hypothetical protein